MAPRDEMLRQTSDPTEGVLFAGQRGPSAQADGHAGEGHAEPGPIGRHTATVYPLTYQLREHGRLMGGRGPDGKPWVELLAYIDALAELRDRQDAARTASMRVARLGGTPPIDGPTRGPTAISDLQGAEEDRRHVADRRVPAYERILNDVSAPRLRSGVTIDNVERIFTYIKPNEAQVAAFTRFRAAAVAFASILLDEVPPCHDRDEAIDLLRGAVHRANAAISLRGEV